MNLILAYQTYRVVEVNIRSHWCVTDQTIHHPFRQGLRVLCRFTTSNMAQKSMVGKAVEMKMVLLGASDVGKSSLALRFANDEFFTFHGETAGGAFFSRTVDVDDSKVTFDLWDTSGEERYCSLAPMFYRGAHAILIVYDITSEESFQVAVGWVKEIKQKSSPNVVIGFVGNKADLTNKREVDHQKGFSYAKENGLLFMETSACTAFNVKEIFLAVARNLCNSDLKQQEDQTDDIDLSTVMEEFYEGAN